MWRELDLKMTFTTPLCGGVPRDPEIIDRWVDTRGASDKHHANLLTKMDPLAKANLDRACAEGEAIEAENAASVVRDWEKTDAKNRIKETKADVKEAIAAEKRIAASVKTLEQVRQERQDTIDPLAEVSEQDKVWVGFSRDDKGLFVRGANLRAHLKDCAGVVGPHAKAGKVPDMSAVLNFRSKAVNAIYIKEDRLHILNGDGSVATKATGFRDATLSVMTAQGPRTCLKRVDYLDPCTIKATILLYPGEITRDWLKVLLDYGCVHGFGQDRSLQFGRYVYELGE